MPLDPSRDEGVRAIELGLISAFRCKVSHEDIKKYRGTIEAFLICDDMEALNIAQELLDSSSRPL